MRIQPIRCAHGDRRRVEAAGGKLENGLNLLPCSVILLDDFLDTRSQFEVFKEGSAVGLTQSSDEFGWSVAVSGDTVAVGAYGESSSSTGINSSPNELASGAARFTAPGVDVGLLRYDSLFGRNVNFH